MNKFRFVLVSAWLALVSVISPISISVSYFLITGQRKGGYELDGERGFSVTLGVVFLSTWILSCFPAMAWMIKKCYYIKKIYALIPISGVIVLFSIGVLFIGHDEFLQAFW